LRVANRDTQAVDLLRGKERSSALHGWLQKAFLLQIPKSRLGETANLDDLLKIVVIRHGCVCSEGHLVESGIFRVQIPDVFLVFPQADSHNFLSFMGDENQFVHESVPVLQQGQDFFFELDQEFLGEIFFSRRVI
jgi:hypothetical protein